MGNSGLKWGECMPSTPIFAPKNKLSKADFIKNYYSGKFQLLGQSLWKIFAYNASRTISLENFYSGVQCLPAVFVQWQSAGTPGTYEDFPGRGTSTGTNILTILTILTILYLQGYKYGYSYIL